MRVWINFNIKRLFYCSFFLIIFYQIFVASWGVDWRTKFSVFAVPAFTYPGGDARNIQVSAHCHRKGFEYYGRNECLAESAIVKGVYPEANVPVLNYPSVWPKLYGIFENDSERFFKFFWAINAGLLVIGILALSFKYNYYIAPFLLFNPITLLTIERGNIDAATFFFTFFPLIFLRSERWIGLFLGLATALKVFPLFGFLAFFRLRRKFYPLGVIFGLLVVSLPVIYTLLDVPHMIDGTSKGFAVAYGLTSIFQTKLFESQRLLAYILVIFFLLIILAALIFSQRIPKIKLSAHEFLLDLDQNKILILSVSLCIFLGTFFVFTNWSYRLIFLIPAIIISSGSSKVFGRLMFAIIFLIMWSPIFPKIPFLPHGWVLQNLLCYVLTLPASLLMFEIFLDKYKVAR